jgi:selenocysteine lyase/cysteine desulfurase
MAGTTAAVDYLAAIGADAGDDRRGRLVAAMQRIFDYEQGLSARLTAGLASLPGVRVQGITDPSALDRRVPTVSFTHERKAPAETAAALAERNIFVWSGHNYALEAAESLGINASGGAVRIGAVHYNSADEIDAVLNDLEDILT